MNNFYIWEKFKDIDNLKLAWMKVSSNMGCPGVDKVSIKDFQFNLEENLQVLNKILSEQTYEPLPFLKITVPKNNLEKRNINIPAIRDRIVQTAIVNILEPIFEKKFIDSSYGYRPDKSAIKALNKIQKYIKNGNTWVLDSDIDSFFDNVDTEILFDLIKKEVSDKKLLNLLYKLLKAGEQYNGKGIPQGAVTSPLFSNIYLNEFDISLTNNQYNLIRYADDFVILTKNEKEASNSLKDVEKILESLKLKINKDKTKIINVTETPLIFLGYEINEYGRKPSFKSVQNFVEKIHKEVNMPFKKERIKGIINGWKGYYNIDDLTLKEIKDKLEKLEETDKSPQLKIILIATLIELDEIDNAREKLINYDFISDDPKIYKDIGIIAMELKLTKIAYENFLKSYKLNNNDSEITYYLGLIYLQNKKIELAINLFQKTLDIDPNFLKAKYALSLAYKKLNLNNLSKTILEDEIDVNNNSYLKKEFEILFGDDIKKDIYWSSSDLKKFIKIFSGREGVFATQWIDNRGRVGYLPQRGNIKEKDVLSHLKGDITLGVYVSRLDNTVNFLVIDIDIKKNYLEKEINEEMINDLEDKINVVVQNIKNYAEKIKFPVYIENSGYKGRHIWIFFSSPIKSSDAIDLAKIFIENISEIPKEISIEIFPKEQHISPKSLGSLIKLPFGKHRKTGKFSYFIDNGEPYDNIEFVNSVKRISKEEVLKVKNNKKYVNYQISNDIEKLINKCNIIKYLVNKAKEVHELNHIERLVLLYTFGHLNEDGKNYIHYLMSECSNYDYNFTQKWINRLEKNKNPISCPKIRMWLNYITPSVGCYCEFDLKDNQYPSPILHIKEINKNDEAISYQNSKKLELEKFNIKEENKMDENFKNNINTLLNEYLKLKKEKKIIEENLKNIEVQMKEIFEIQKIDSLETDYGLLRIVKNEEKITWIIEV